MRKFTIIALTALCFALPGTVQASNNSNYFTSEFFSSNSQISSELVEEILKYVAVEYGYDLQCLCADYAKGTITIEKIPTGYEVAMTLHGGNVGVISVIEDI